MALNNVDNEIVIAFSISAAVLRSRVASVAHLFSRHDPTSVTQTAIIMSLYSACYHQLDANNAQCTRIRPLFSMQNT
jgi:hypothetical protein